VLVIAALPSEARVCDADLGRIRAYIEANPPRWSVLSDEASGGCFERPDHFAEASPALKVGAWFGRNELRPYEKDYAVYVIGHDSERVGFDTGEPVGQ
jgi:hypothetical protein